jgi:hypothetical protein
MDDNFNIRFDLINQLSDVQSQDLTGKPTGLLIHAILNTIDLFDLVKFYIHEIPDNQTISRNILKRLPAYSEPNEVYDYVFEQLRMSSYVNRLRFRKILDILIEIVDETRQQEYFTFFSNSNYRYEIKAAIKITGMIWSDELATRFLRNYKETGNSDILEVLIANLEHDQFITLAKSVWTQELPNYLKPKLINRVKGWPLQDVEFVKYSDPGNFIVLARYLNEAIEDEILLDCFDRTPEKYKPFAIWNLGRLGKWQLIIDPIRQFIQDPDNTFVGFSATIFE